MYFNRIMLDVVQHMPDTINSAHRNDVLNNACRNMSNALVSIDMGKMTGNYEQVKHQMCVLVHNAVIYLHAADILATDVSSFEYEDALFVQPCANLQAIPVPAWKAHIPQWGDSIIDTHLPSLVFSVLAWCSVNHWGFNQQWSKYRESIKANARLMLSAMNDCGCEPIVVNKQQLELPL